MLRTVLFFGPTDGQLRSALVTSTEAGEGKSTVVANLAQSVAKWGKPVLVIDADVHRPGQHRIFGIENEVGLAARARSGGRARLASDARAHAGTRG